MWKIIILRLDYILQASRNETYCHGANSMLQFHLIFFVVDWCDSAAVSRESHRENRRFSQVEWIKILCATLFSVYKNCIINFRCPECGTRERVCEKVYEKKIKSSDALRCILLIFVNHINFTLDQQWQREREEMKNAICGVKLRGCSVFFFNSGGGCSFHIRTVWKIIQLKINDVDRRRDKNSHI